MSEEDKPEDGTRRCVQIRNENYYVILGDDFIQVNVPFENRIEMEKPRDIAEGIAQAVFDMMKEKFCIEVNPLTEGLEIE